MNSIVRSPFTEQERENICRYQSDSRLRDRLTCPNLVAGKVCEENYSIPGMFTFFPIFRNTILQLINDTLYCPQCRASIQDWVPFTIAKYTLEVQKEVHQELDEALDQQCKDMVAKAQSCREITFDRLRSELADLRYMENPTQPNRAFRHEFYFPDYPHLRLSIGYEGEVSMLYSIGAFVSSRDYRYLQHFFDAKWEGTMKDHLLHWAILTVNLPSYWDVPLK